MAEAFFTRQFLRELAEWDGQASPADIERLDEILARIVKTPDLPGRVASYYDPAEPTYLFRAGALLIHYRIRPNGGVEFRNLLFRRV